MPASLPGETNANNRTGNPSAGRPVTFDLLSGPKGSPKSTDITGNASSGALATGIGFGPAVSPIGGSIPRAGFTDDYTPGVTKPDGTASTNATYMYIGGGKTAAAGATLGRPFPPS